MSLHNVGIVSSFNHHLLLPVLGSNLTAHFLVMKYQLEEIGLLPLEETAPSELLTWLSFLPRMSRLPHATCNNILASVLTRLSQMLQLGQPNPAHGDLWGDLS